MAATPDRARKSSARVVRRCPTLPGNADDRRRAVVPQQQERECEDQAGHRDQPERGPPSPRRGEDPAEHEAEQGAQRRSGLERAEHGGPLACREHRGEQRACRRAVPGLARADCCAGGEQLRIVLREAAGERGETPGRPHHGDGLHPAPAISHQRDRERTHRHADRDNGHERAQLCVRQPPLRLQVRERRHHDLPVDEVQGHQDEGHPEHRPGMALRHRCGARLVEDVGSVLDTGQLQHDRPLQRVGRVRRHPLTVDHSRPNGAAVQRQAFARSPGAPVRLRSGRTSLAHPARAMPDAAEARTVPGARMRPTASRARQTR